MSASAAFSMADDDRSAVRIPLTRGLFAIVDADDADRVRQHKWSAVARRWLPDKYWARSGNGAGQIYIHRFVLGIDHIPEVIHLNGNQLDNRRANLLVKPRRVGVGRGSTPVPRKIVVEGETAFIPVAADNGIIYATIDAADVDLVSAWNWRMVGVKGNQYVTAKVCRRPFRLHRYLLNAPRDMFGDHIDGDVLNNRRSNLRLATPAGNTQNRKRSFKNTSGIKGVTKTRSGKWRARIAIGGKESRLGTFDDIADAAAAYRRAAERLFGEFATTRGDLPLSSGDAA